MTFVGLVICQINQNLNKDLYLEILHNELMNIITHYNLNKSNIIFQHDNNPKYITKIVKDQLKDQEFETLVWPTQSPDFNPIEHLWAIVKRKLHNYEELAKGIVELQERVEEIQENISIETCIKLIESIPRRIDAILKAKGYWTKY